jgi:hypothetical protein
LAAALACPVKHSFEQNALRQSRQKKALSSFCLHRRHESSDVVPGARAVDELPVSCTFSSIGRSSYLS